MPSSPTAPAEESPEPAAAEVERRHMTVLFLDIAGSTELSTRLDPEDVRSLLREYQNIVAGEITRYEGHIARFFGDGVLCYFGWPTAHEDDAERAVRAALSIMEGLAGLTTAHGEAIGVRAGLSTGMVVVGDLVGEGASQEEMVIGETPNLAARIQDLARPGEVVISASTRSLLGGLFQLDSLGLRDLKGIPEPVEAFVVHAERELTSRFEAQRGQHLSAMVGREQELALVMERWHQARAGEGQVVLLTGEAGIGKSRVARAVVDEVLADDHVRVRYQRRLGSPVAHHASAAGRAEAAFQYWNLAGNAALVIPAYREAISHLRSALRLLPDLGQDEGWRRAELELQIALGQALIAAEGYAARPTAAAFDRALVLAEEIGDPDWLFPALYGVWADRYIRSEPAPDLADRFMEATNDALDTGPRLVALRAKGLEEFHEGLFAKSLTRFQQILDRYDESAHADLAERFGHDARAAGFCYRGWSTALLGHADQARRAVADAEAWARKRNHGNTLGYVLSYGAIVPLALQQRIEDVERLAAEAIAVADDLVLGLWHGFAQVFWGWARAWQGDETGLSPMKAGLAEVRATGAERLMPFVEGLAAEAQARCGDRDGAFETMEEAFDALSKTGDMAWEAGLHAARGRLSSADPARTDDAIADLERAIELARRRDARWVELTATTQLAHIWRQDGRIADAVAALEPIHGWFTEGADTAALTEAADLLEAMS